MATGKKVAVVLSFEALDRVTAPIRKLNRQLETIGAPVRRFNNALNRFGRVSGLNAVKTSLANIGSGLINVGNTAFTTGLKIAGLGISAYYAFQRLISGPVELNSRLGETAERLKISTDFLQKWGFVAEQTGASSEALFQGLTKFSQNLSKARRGGGELVNLLGQDSEFLNKLTRMKTTEEAFEVFINQLGRVPDEADAVTLALAGMGRGASELINLSKLSKEERAALIKQKEAIGLLSREQISGFKAFGDLLKAVSTRLQFLQATVATRLMPVFETLFKRFDSWIQRNQPMIERFAQMFADRIPVAIEAVLIAVKNLAAVFGPFILWITSDVERLRILLYAIGLYIAGPLLVAIGSLGLPFLAVAGAVLLIWRYWDNIVAAIKTAVEWVKKFPTYFSRGGQFNVAANGADYGPQNPAAAAMATSPQSLVQSVNTQTKSEASVKVFFDNLPKGTSVQPDKNSEVPLEIFTGRTMSGW